MEEQCVRLTVNTGNQHVKHTDLLKTSRQHVRLARGNATRMPDISGECSTTAATWYRVAR